ncbi:MAG: hypothetical protein KAW12_10015 [Candidatus Aminicenantes bacterium]|nr:hypothetical protein [Candidatus Aminicenantes bacterium]
MKKLLKNKWFRRVLFPGLGVLGGFAYYYFIGCSGNTCPISSNPYISMGYGAVMGLVFSMPGKRPRRGHPISRSAAVHQKPEIQNPKQIQN